MTEGICQEPGCERVAPIVALACPAGRPDAMACFCDEHGGTERARAEAEQDWNYLAPDRVGDAEMVRIAGMAGLQTTEAYLLVKQQAPAQGSTWLAFLGIGTASIPVVNPRAVAAQRGTGTSKGRRAFPDMRSALTVGTDVWYVNLDQRMRNIAYIRGGTFDWGTPVTPLEKPIVLVLLNGDTRSGWDVARDLPRRTPLSHRARRPGLRPSGEIE